MVKQDPSPSTNQQHTEFATALSDNKALLLKAIQQTKICLHWYSSGLDPLIANNMDIYQAFLELYKNNRKIKFKLLVHQTQEVMRKGHCLIPLIQRLSSAFEVKKTDAEYAKRDYATYLIVDKKIIYYRSIETQWEGRLEMDNSYQAKQLMIQFETVWALSSIDSQLRRLI
ncbi:MAG: hypothetical protein COW84_08985 [Gammaproteobacteria bacterium CG22_combo_CG10-13_8_21_14_all_40_8]|nr:MAG: hypothetical protein COW84_08985 [Gammaproteobacteria bacterium CG22_combo_CG10-13_8_21_14_all_40_8]